MSLMHDEQMSEAELRHQVISLKERGRCREADELYREWKQTNAATSAETLFHVANCQLLHGLIHDARTTAELMFSCPDFEAHPLLWGDFLADLSMAYLKKGRTFEARLWLDKSTGELHSKNADESRLLRNELFVTRIMAREGSPAAVHALWDIRNRYARLMYTDESADAIYFRNLNWWLVVFAARFPEATVNIDGTSLSPFDYICANTTCGIPLKSGWTGMETRPRHRQVLEFLKEYPRLRKATARMLISGRIHTS